MVQTRTVRAFQGTRHPEATAYGWQIDWPAGGPFNTEGDQVALINREGGDLIDALVYINEDMSNFDTEDEIRDMVQDTDALTGPTGGFGFVLDSGAGWTGPDDFKGQTTDTVLDALAPFAVTFPFGFGDGGSIQRKMSGSAFMIGSPDGTAHFEALEETSWGLRPSDTFGATLSMPAVYFRPGMTCDLIADLCNPGPTAVGLPLFVLLDAGGIYYFWDGWTTDPDFFEVTVPRGHTVQSIIPAFTWPQISDSASGLSFIAAITDPEVTRVIGDYDTWEFAFGP